MSAARRHLRSTSPSLMSDTLSLTQKYCNSPLTQKTYHAILFTYSTKPKGELQCNPPRRPFRL
jgi:hypothetical protein